MGRSSGSRGERGQIAVVPLHHESDNFENSRLARCCRETLASSLRHHISTFLLGGQGVRWLVWTLAVPTVQQSGLPQASADDSAGPASEARVSKPRRQLSRPAIQTVYRSGSAGL